MRNDIDGKLDSALVNFFLRRQSMLRSLLRAAVPSGRTTGGRGTVFTPEQYAIILVLDTYGHGVTVKEIAEGVAAPHANVTRTLERLEKKGLVYSTRGSEDKRQVMVRLTLAGSKLARQLNEITNLLHQRLWDGLDERDKKTLLELLSR